MYDMYCMYYFQLVKLKLSQLLSMWTIEGLMYCSNINILAKIWFNITRVTMEEAMIAANQMV